MNTYTQCWRHLKTAKEIQNKLIKNNAGLRSNQGKLLPATMDILAFIGSNPNATITSITKEPYFNELSFSTIKRCVLELLKCRAIISTIAKDDGRIRHLNIMEVN